MCPEYVFIIRPRGRVHHERSRSQRRDVVEHAGRGDRSNARCERIGVAPGVDDVERVETEIDERGAHRWRHCRCGGELDLEPDVAVFDASIETHNARGVDLLLVVEVASSSIGFDLRVKAPLYASFGVRDYWVIDAMRSTVRVHRNPVDGRYLDVTEWTDKDVMQPLLLADIAIRLTDLK